MSEYFPYICKDDAINEYNSLRKELLESQKQRVNLLTASIAFITAIFAFLSKDKNIELYESVILIYLSIIPCLYSYATRIRERRIANYISIFLKNISPWSDLSSSDDNKFKLNIFQRSSTTIVISFILFDIIIFIMPMKLPIVVDKYFIASVLGIIFNLFVLIYTRKLKNFKPLFEKAILKLKENIAKQKEDTNSSPTK